VATILKKLEHAVQDFSIIDLKYCSRRKVSQLKKRGSGFNIKTTEHAGQDFSIIDLKYCWRRRLTFS
jgi:hypothetical protein